MVKVLRYLVCETSQSPQLGTSDGPILKVACHKGTIFSLIPQWRDWVVQFLTSNEHLVSILILVSFMGFLVQS
jgi:hypothetical protein